MTLGRTEMTEVRGFGFVFSTHSLGRQHGENSPRRGLLPLCHLCRRARRASARSPDRHPRLPGPGFTLETLRPGGTSVLRPLDARTPVRGHPPPPPGPGAALGPGSAPRSSRFPAAFRLQNPPPDGHPDLPGLLPTASPLSSQTCFPPAAPQLSLLYPPTFPRQRLRGPLPTHPASTRGSRCARPQPRAEVTPLGGGERPTPSSRTHRGTFLGRKPSPTERTPPRPGGGSPGPALLARRGAQGRGGKMETLEPEVSGGRTRIHHARARDGAGPGTERVRAPNRPPAPVHGAPTRRFP